MIYGHPVLAATRALRFSDHVTKRNGGSGDENAISMETVCNAHAWPQQCWKSCANGSNIVAVRFGDHGKKELSANNVVHER